MSRGVTSLLAPPSLPVVDYPTTGASGAKGVCHGIVAYPLNTPLGQAQLLYAMCVEKRKWSNKYACLTIPSPPSHTALPINHQRVHCKALPFVFPLHPAQTLTVPAKESASAMRTVVRKCCSSSLPASATRRRLGSLRNGSARLKNSTVSIHDACVDNVSLGADRAQQ